MFKTIVGIIIIVFIGCIIDVAYMRLQTVRGKLPFKFTLTPNLN